MENALPHTPSLSKKIGLILGPVLFGIVMLFSPDEALSTEALAVMATTLWIATWWISEAIPIEATALLPIVLFPLSGALDLGTTTGAYGHYLIFLFLGGFIIALAIEKWNLHRRIALNIIYVIGTNNQMLVLGFMVATWFLSMWISNTATSLMMMPIGLAIIKQLEKDHDPDPRSASPFSKALMLGIAYSASIGGMATLIGTPPNLVFAAVVKATFDIEISFLQWFIFGLPFSIILTLICWWYLVKIAFNLEGESSLSGRDQIKAQLKALGPMSKEEKRVLIVFVATAFCWITRSFLLNLFIPKLTDTMIAVAGALALFLIAAPNHQGEKLMDWSNTVKLPWGILMLFGGGLALAAGFTQSGLAEWIGSKMTLMEGIHFILILIAITALVNFLTEITSNVATASMILPILASLALAIGIHPYGLMVPAILAASCAFMLPVATPPNAVVFGSGFIQMKDMIRSGLRLNLMSIILIVVYVFVLLPLLWQLDLNSVPAEFLIP